MVSDSEIITRLREYLQTSDLNTTTAASIRRKLEEDLGIDLSDKKIFVREQIDLYLQSQYEVTEEDKDDDDAQGSDGAPADVEEGEAEAAEEQIEESKASNLKGGEEDENANDEEEDENANDEEEEEEADERTSKKRTGMKRCNKQNKEGKKKGNGFTKLCSLSPQLQKLLGVPEMARTEVVKQLWVYIKEKDLQDPSDRRNIICDDNLHELFRVKKINMFQMNKALAKHIWPLGSLPEGEPDDDEEANQEEEVKEEEEAELENNSSNSKDGDDNEHGKKYEETNTRLRRVKKTANKKNTEVKKRGGGGGFTMLCSLSPKLQSFTGVTEMARTQVVKFAWAYIKENNLQDPSDRRSILCDEKLHDLFGVKSINMFQMNKALAKHIWPLERDDRGTPVSTTDIGNQEMQDSEEDEEPKRKKKRKKGGISDSDIPLNISDALIDFLGTDESVLPFANVEKRIREYIQQNNLQDPSDEKIIICNEKLKGLFEVESFHDSALPKLLTTHLTTTEQ